MHPWRMKCRRSTGMCAAPVKSGRRRRRRRRRSALCGNFPTPAERTTSQRPSARRRGPCGRGCAARPVVP
eukprot:8743855-Alexandrium_andersonii.AAC.1